MNTLTGTPLYIPTGWDLVWQAVPPHRGLGLLWLKVVQTTRNNVKKPNLPCVEKWTPCFNHRSVAIIYTFFGLFSFSIIRLYPFRISFFWFFLLSTPLLLKTVITIVSFLSSPTAVATTYILHQGTSPVSWLPGFLRLPNLFPPFSSFCVHTVNPQTGSISFPIWTWYALFSSLDKLIPVLDAISL